MPYIFKSSATGNLILLTESAEKILRIIGKIPAPAGIITTDQINHAIQLLQQAIEQEKAQDQTEKSTLTPEESDDADPAWSNREITLHQRAWPFIEMLKACLGGLALKPMLILHNRPVLEIIGTKYDPTFRQYLINAMRRGDHRHATYAKKQTDARAYTPADRLV